MSRIEFGGIALSDARGNPNTLGRIWCRMAYLAMLNRALGKDSFTWSGDHMANYAGCSKNVALDAAEQAVDHEVIQRTKVNVGDRTMWRYVETEKTWDLYVLAVREGVCEVVLDESAGEKARKLANKRLISGVDKLVLVQLARQSLGQEALVSYRELAEQVTSQRREVNGEDDPAISHTSVRRALSRLEDQDLVMVRTSPGRSKTLIWVALSEQDVEMARSIRTSECSTTTA